MTNAPDIQASLENADEIAELTGRSKADVIADLLDDGKLNNSNAIKENTSALDKATEMAGKTHKLLTALIPILILVAGSGLELGGIIDLTPAGSGDDDWGWEDDPYVDTYWGCTDWDAENYDEYATDDDGTCYYEDDGPIEGCTDDTAENYDPEAEEDDGSCTYEEDEPPACQWIIWRGEPGDNATAPTIFNNVSANTTTVRFDIDENKNCGEYWIDVYVGAINNAGDWIEEQHGHYKRYGQKYENDTLTLNNLSCGIEYDIYIALYDQEGEYADQFVFDNRKRECE